MKEQILIPRKPFMTSGSGLMQHICFSLKTALYLICLSIEKQLTHSNFYVENNLINIITFSMCVFM
jgi:hypothetical protein